MQYSTVGSLFQGPLNIDLPADRLKRGITIHRFAHHFAWLRAIRGAVAPRQRKSSFPETLTTIFRCIHPGRISAMFRSWKSRIAMT